MTAVQSAEDAVTLAQRPALVADLVVQSTDERLAPVDPYLTPQARAFLTDPKNASRLEGFVLDPGADSGEKVTKYIGPSISQVATTISGTTGDLVVALRTDAPITTDQGRYVRIRDYTLDMVQAPDAPRGWQIASVGRLVGNLTKTSA